jgi:predicted amidophosphoribosyltransferase
MGVPAVHAGWMCYCGQRLPEGSDVVCHDCGREYSIAEGVCCERTAQPESPADDLAVPIAA